MFSGVFKKMISIHDDPVRYILDFDDDLLFLNQLIGKNFKIHKTGYCCLSCQENIEIFANGFCKKCFFESPMSGDWVMKPELSKAHLNIQDRDLEYEKKIQLQDHIVYLSKTSGVKVGVTRSNNKTTRWIDQGAIEAIELIEVPNRYLAGIAEVKLKNVFSDKTNWRKMLTNDIEDLNIINNREDALNILGSEFKEYFKTNSKVFKFNYYRKNQINSVKSASLKKTDIIEGRLIGIKGQYLIFEDSTVFNVRSNEGYKVDITIN
tara:strand:+ start:4053 stop:4844 length:792 start_codon:yes stop_codon:yes gene_type:complete